MNQEENQRTLRVYIDALVRQDPQQAADCLSAGFGCHEGKDRDAYLRHELREFSRLMDRYGLANGIRLYTDTAEADCLRFSVADCNGVLVYEDALLFDADGRIRGDGSRFEVVSKIRFRDQSVYRALAIRGFGEAPGFLVIDDDPVGECDVHPASTHADDGFHVTTFMLDGDDFRTRPARVRIYPLGGGVPDQKRMVLRGVDHPFFEPSLFPEVRGRAVSIPKSRAKPWSLNVKLKGGAWHEIQQPRALHWYGFDQDVVFAVLTDAVDNDWITEGE